jgi:hypothetical protein
MNNFVYNFFHSTFFKVFFHKKRLFNVFSWGNICNTYDIRQGVHNALACMMNSRLCFATTIAHRQS